MAHGASREGAADIVLILLAIFLPPIAVLLKTGVGFHLLLNIILTIIFIIPGSLHALWVVLAK